MATNGFRIDRAGVSEILKVQCAPVINEITEQVADAVRADVRDVGDDIEVEMQSYTTDRGAAAVTIAHPLGLELQATRGSITKAAAALGLEVKA